MDFLMAMIKKSITITEQQGQWMQAQMQSGNYGTDSELIREALREKQSRMAELEVLRAKLIAGENSRFTKLSRHEILQEIKDDLKADG
jgi:antitoxin ParD1/3/4